MAFLDPKNTEGGDKIDWSTMKPVYGGKSDSAVATEDALSSQIDWGSMKAEEPKAGMPAPTVIDPVEGYYSRSRIDKALQLSRDMMRFAIPSMEELPSLIPGQKTGVPNVIKFAGQMTQKAAMPLVPVEGMEEIFNAATDVLFTRPLSALTALAVDTPFDGSGRTGVLETVYKGYTQPEKYPPTEMVTALIDSGMEPTSAAVLATLGQFGFYLGAGEAMANVVTTGKVKLLQGAVKNIGDAVQEAQGQAGAVVSLKPEIAKAVAEHSDLATVVDIYAKSKNFRLLRNHGSVELLSSGEVPLLEGPGAKVPKDIKTFGIKAPTQGRFSMQSELGKAFGKIEGTEASISGIEAAKKGQGYFEKVIEDLSKMGVKTLRVKIQSESSRAALKRLVDKGVLVNPRDLTGVSTDEYPTTFDIKGKTEKPSQKTSEVTQDTGDTYALNRDIALANEQNATPIRDAIARTGERISEEANRAFVPVSTRFAKISEDLKHALRKFEFRQRRATFADLEKVKPFLDKYSKLPPNDALDLDFALKNRDAAKVDEIIKRNDMTKEFEAVKALLDDIHARATAADIGLGFIEEYFPRRIGDSEGFLQYLRNSENWNAIDQAIAIQEEAQGYAMLDTEKADFINKLLRGNGGTGIWLRLPANVKARIIDVIKPEMNQYYKDSAQALLDYIEGMDMAIETRKFFGKGEGEIESSIGNYVKELLDEGMIDTSQAKAVRDILKARFNQKGTQGLWTTYKNLSYLATMNSPLNAITQIGDLAFALYRNGYFRTGKALFTKGLKKEDVGIHNIAQEFSGDASLSNKAVTQVFKAIGLDKIDRIGKEALINSSWERLKKEAATRGDELLPELEMIFGEEAPQVLADLKAGDASENVKYLLFSELSDFQPISLSEMPEYYLRGGNWRILYMLKSYTLKVIDAYHNEVFRQMKTDPVKGMQNFIRLTAALTLMGVTADWLKDFILGKTKELSNYVLDNLLKTAALNKYTIANAKKEGIINAFWQSIMPPTPFVDTVARDMMSKKDIADWKTWSKIPFVGTFYYWWLGGGSKEQKGPARYR